MILAVFSLTLVACSNHNATTATPPPGLFPSIAGAWEFIATSNQNTSSATGIEVALKEGQVLAAGVEEPNGQVSASGTTQIGFVGLNLATGAVVFGGNCVASGDGSSSLSGTVSAADGTLSFTYLENGNVFNVSGSLSSDGKSFNGTYTSAAGSACSDSGTITGSAVAKLTGMYTGQLLLPDGTTDSVTATLGESSANVLNLNLLVSGSDNVTFSLSGPVVGNTFLIQGTFESQSVSYEGYSLQVLDPTTQITVPTLYIVNTTNPAQPVFAGALTIPPPTP